MRGLICVTVLAAAATLTAAQETKLGAGVTLKEATPVSALIAKPADYVGKTIRVDGVATAVCEEMGCWLALSADGAEDEQGREAAGEHASHDAAAARTYQIKATGAVIR